MQANNYPITTFQCEIYLIYSIFGVNNENMNIEKQIDAAERELIRLLSTDGYVKEVGCTIILKNRKIHMHGDKTAIAVVISQILTEHPEIVKELQELPYAPKLVMPLSVDKPSNI